MKAISPDRRKRFAAVIAVIATGTTLRLTGYEAGLPYSLVKYGGSLLWGVMIYLLVTVILPGRPRLQLFLSVTIAVAAELLRLYHTPWLDEFRLTLAGALLLGRIFSVWNIVAYLAGITVAAAIDHVLTVKRCSAHTPQSWPLHDPDDNITGPGGRAPSLLARSY